MLKCVTLLLGIKNRIIHLIRHAESEFNVLANHQTEGFVPRVTKLDAGLTPKGMEQAKLLGHRLQNEMVNGFPIDHRFAPKNADIVITSPMTRTILTAFNSLPVDAHKYLVRPEIAEQVENTTDLPLSKHKLMAKFPALHDQIEALPDCWWHRHPLSRMNGTVDPQHDADLLHLYNGEEPAAESKELVRNRVQRFFQWLHEKEQEEWRNIVVYSHCCTIYEMERLLKGIDVHVQHHDDLSMPTNTEIRSFDLMHCAFKVE